MSQLKIIDFIFLNGHSTYATPVTVYKHRSKGHK